MWMRFKTLVTRVMIVLTTDRALILFAKKRILSIFLVLAVGFCANAQDVGIKRVVIDPGHGGKDPGAVGPSKVYEKDVALSVSLKVGELIKKNHPEIEVIYTRSTDVFIGLAERAKKANKISADLFISIHANAAANKSAYGAEVWVLGLHKSQAALEIAKKENSSILMEDDHGTTYQDFDPSDPDHRFDLASSVRDRRSLRSTKTVPPKAQPRTSSDPARPFQDPEPRQSARRTFQADVHTV